MAEKIRHVVKTRVEKMDQAPRLAVLLIGDDPASHTYVKIKGQACAEAGIGFEKFLYVAETPENVLLEKIAELNARADITGILVQLPLPSQNASTIIAIINPNKDVDGFHPENLRRLRAGEPSIASAVALGVMKLLDAANPSFAKTAALVCSPLFAEPLVLLLRERKISADIVKADDAKIKTADIVVVAVGKPGIIRGEMIKPGSVVIDVGTTKIDGKLVGDVDEASVEPIAGYLTPVPGGVGPMTVAMLLVNILKAQDLQRRAANADA